MCPPGAAICLESVPDSLFGLESPYAVPDGLFGLESPCDLIRSPCLTSPPVSSLKAGSETPAVSWPQGWLTSPRHSQEVVDSGREAPGQRGLSEGGGAFQVGRCLRLRASPPCPTGASKRRQGLPTRRGPAVDSLIFSSPPVSITHPSTPGSRVLARAQ